jgi:hypothetical protein
MAEDFATEALASVLDLPAPEKSELAKDMRSA